MSLRSVSAKSIDDRLPQEFTDWLAEQGYFYGSYPKEPITHLSQLPIDLAFVYSKISRIFPISGSLTLSKLCLDTCHNIVDLSSLRYLPSITVLGVYDCDSVTIAPSLAEFPSITALSIERCKNLEDISGIRGSQTLTNLSLRQCTKVTSISTLKELPSLAWVNLIGCTGVVDITALVQLPSLEDVLLKDCTGITCISALTHLFSKSATLKDVVGESLEEREIREYVVLFLLTTVSKRLTTYY